MERKNFWSAVRDIVTQEYREHKIRTLLFFGFVGTYFTFCAGALTFLVWWTHVIGVVIPQTEQKILAQDDAMHFTGDIVASAACAFHDGNKLAQEARAGFQNSLSAVQFMYSTTKFVKTTLNEAQTWHDYNFQSRRLKQSILAFPEPWVYKETMSSEDVDSAAVILGLFSKNAQRQTFRYKLKKALEYDDAEQAVKTDVAAYVENVLFEEAGVNTFTAFQIVAALFFTVPPYALPFFLSSPNPKDAANWILLFAPQSLRDNFQQQLHNKILLVSENYRKAMGRGCFENSI